MPFDKAGADLLFGFISQRYERRSLVVTTNLPFARWSEVFLDATAPAAVIDRIVRHATVLTTSGDTTGSRPPHATRRPARQRRCLYRATPLAHLAGTLMVERGAVTFQARAGEPRVELLAVGVDAAVIGLDLDGDAGVRRRIYGTRTKDKIISP